MSSTGPFSYFRTINNGATFDTFLGKVTATEVATVTATANYGTLSVNANAVATSSFSAALFGDYGVAAAGQPIVEFTDTLTIAPTAGMPVGTPVSVKFTDAFTQSEFSIIGSSPDTSAQLVGTLLVTGDGTYLSGVFGQSFQADQGYFIPLPPPAGGDTAGDTYGDATSVSTNLILKVGTVYTITGGIFAVGQAAATSDISEGTSNATNAVVESATSQLYIDTGGPGYNTASAVTYPAVQLPPLTLSIQPAITGGVTISWPAGYTNYILQQNSVLHTTNWIPNTNSVSVSNGTNRITVTPATGIMYFRLAGH